MFTVFMGLYEKYFNYPRDFDCYFKIKVLEIIIFSLKHEINAEQRLICWAVVVLEPCNTFLVCVSVC